MIAFVIKGTMGKPITVQQRGIASNLFASTTTMGQLEWIVSFAVLS